MCFRLNCKSDFHSAPPTNFKRNHYYQFNLGKDTPINFPRKAKGARASVYFTASHSWYIWPKKVENLSACYWQKKNMSEEIRINETAIVSIVLYSVHHAGQKPRNIRDGTIHKNHPALNGMKRRAEKNIRDQRKTKLNRIWALAIRSSHAPDFRSTENNIFINSTYN